MTQKSIKMKSSSLEMDWLISICFKNRNRELLVIFGLVINPITNNIGHSNFGQIQLKLDLTLENISQFKILNDKSLNNELNISF